MLFQRALLGIALVGFSAEPALAVIPGGNEPFESYRLTHTDGVETRAGQSVLVVHHARMYPASPNNAWIIPAIDERLPLELCPSTGGNSLTVRVLWQGSVLCGVDVTADLPDGKRIEGRTDGSGDFTMTMETVEAGDPGLYTFRAKHEEKVTGERDGKKYASILHYSTLVAIVVRGHAAGVASAAINASDSPRAAYGRAGSKG